MISVKNLSYSYNDGKLAVDDVSFDIEDGSFVSIIGHNGSGKSTISKLLVGLLEAKCGSISYDGVVLNSDSVYDIRKDVGIVFQNPDNQFVGVDVLHDIAFGLENRNICRDEMVELIDKYSKLVSMDKYLDRAPSNLSGGQKQRVAVAGILALNCKVVILDEALSMLDPLGVSEISSLIYDLKYKFNKTVIAITHDLSLASKSDKVLVMKEGKLVYEGTPSEVFSNKELLVSSNLDMPYSLKAYHLGRDKGLSSDILEALWEYHLKR